MAKVFSSLSDYDYEDVRCPYCREMQMAWIRKYKTNVLYSHNGLEHDCEELERILKKGDKQ